MPTCGSIAATALYLSSQSVSRVSPHTQPVRMTMVHAMVHALSHRIRHHTRTHAVTQSSGLSLSPLSGIRASANATHEESDLCSPLPHIVRLNRVPRRCNQQETAHFAASHAHARALSTRNYRVRHSNTSRVLHQSATPPLSCCCLALLPFRMRHCHGACPPRAAHSKRPCAVLCCHCFRSSAFSVVVCL